LTEGDLPLALGPSLATQASLMTRNELLQILRSGKLGAIATVSPNGEPQNAVVGYGVSENLEIVFDTLEESRKYQNLILNKKVGFVVWTETSTVQLQATAFFPEGDDLERLKGVYFEAYPDGVERLSWPGLHHVALRPTWARFSDFGQNPPLLVEWSESELT
jgi:uncharacterized pyridoxamine 5'-phosphate oxidase family protein